MRSPSHIDPAYENRSCDACPNQTYNAALAETLDEAGWIVNNDRDICPVCAFCEDYEEGQA